MADQEKGQGQAGVEGASTHPGTAAEDQGTQAQGEKLTLTVAELQSRIDREVTKALKTRTGNLQTELAETKEALAKLQREKTEGSLSDKDKVEAREREIEQAKVSVKEAQKEIKRLHDEIEALVADEVNALSADDKKLVEAAFPEDASPLVRLKVIRALKNSGKLVNASSKTEEPQPTDVGSRKVTRNPPVDTDFQKGVTMGKELAKFGAPKKEPTVPDAWKGR